MADVEGSPLEGGVRRSAAPDPSLDDSHQNWKLCPLFFQEINRRGGGFEIEGGWPYLAC